MIALLGNKWKRPWDQGSLDSRCRKFSSFDRSQMRYKTGCNEFKHPPPKKKITPYPQFRTGISAKRQVCDNIMTGLKSADDLEQLVRNIKM